MAESRAADGPFSETNEHINCFKLLGALFGLKSLCSMVISTHVRIERDNSTTTVSYFNSMGGTVPKKCRKFAKQILDCCISLGSLVECGSHTWGLEHKSR